MSPTNGPSMLRLALAIWLGLVACLAARNFAFYFQAPILETSDAAVNGIMIENAKHFEQIYGNYSRFEFNHPGPAFYYVYALGELLLSDILGVTPSPGNAHLATCMLLQCAFFALAVAMAATWIRRRAWLPLALFAAALCFGANQAAFLSIWPPFVLVMPSLTFLVACMSVASGCLAHLPIAVLSGGFLFHGHVAQSIFVATLTPMALIANLVHHRHAQGSWSFRQWLSRNRTVWIVSAALAAIFVLPLVLDIVLFGRRGNIATILGRFQANTSDSKSVMQSVVYFLTFGTLTTHQEVITSSSALAWEFVRHNVVPLLGWGATAFLPPVAVSFWRRRFSPRETVFLYTGWVFFLCAVGLCVVWGIAQAREMYHFNGAFYYSVYFVAVMLALAVLARAVDRWFPRVVSALMVAAALVVFYLERHVPPLLGPASGLPIQAAVHQGLAGGDQRTPKFLVFEHKHWHVAAAVALELCRRGVGFEVAPWWGFMFGAKHERAMPEPAMGNDSPVWWLANPGDGGVPLTAELSLYTQPAPIRPGDEIRLRADANGFRYVVSGVTFGNTEFAWTNLPDVSFRFATPVTQQDVRIIFDAKSAQPGDDGPVPQRAEVTFNGVSLGDVEVRGRSLVEVRVAATLWNSAPEAVLSMHFPGAVPKTRPSRPRYEAWEAWGLWSLRFEASP